MNIDGLFNGKANIIIIGATCFTYYTYPARRRFFTTIAKLPLIRVHLMESCYNMASKFVFDVHMTYPNTTKDKSHLSMPVKGVDDGFDHRVNYRVSTEVAHFSVVIPPNPW